MEVTKTLNELVFDFFTLCGLEPLEIRRGIWQVNADDSLMKELDGWRARGRLLQFTFEPRLAEMYGADLICPGSYRFNSIARLIRQQGILSRAHIPHHFFHEPSIRQKATDNLNPNGRTYVVNSATAYGQYLSLRILVSLRGLQKKESIHTCVVDLSDGEVLKFALPPHLLQPGGIEPQKLRRRRCGLKKAYESAVDHLLEALSRQEHTWAHDTWKRLHQEEEQLAEFFDGLTDSPEFASKAQELKARLTPTVRVNALRAAFIYIPLFHYRLMLVHPDRTETTRNLYYDPISNSRLLE